MSLLSILIFIAVALTCTMFATRQAMLGFPSCLFWALVGGQAYTLSTTPWGDIYYFIAFASLLGMTIFTALSAFGLRERLDTIADDEMEKGEGEYIGESGGEDKTDEEGEPSRRTKALRERAARRRTGEHKPPRRLKWG